MPPPPPTAGSRGVIVIDDDRDLGLLLERWIQNAGHRAVAFTDPAGAIAAIDSAPPVAVLLDLHLPGATTDQLLSRIRRQYPHAPIIALAGDNDPISARQAVALGASDFVTKPLERTTLLTTLHNALDRASLAARVAHLEHGVTRAGENSEPDRHASLRALVREISRVIAKVESGDDSASTTAATSPSHVSLADQERATITAAIRRTGGNLSKASRVLGIGRTTLYRKMAAYELR